MMYYLIRETLTEAVADSIKDSGCQYVAILSTEEWMSDRELFDMGIDIEPETDRIGSTKAEANYDSVTGSFFIPDRNDFKAPEKKFAFALDEKGVVFIDDGGTVQTIVDVIRNTQKWKFPCLERFLFSFLEQIIRQDRQLLVSYDRELDVLEDEIDLNDNEKALERVYEIRADIRDLKIHYEQLLDLCQEFEENENGFFKTENLRYFRLFISRIERLRDSAVSMTDQVIQIRDIYKARLDIRQNRIMTILTVIATIFMPLTLITGWYGMNFRYMPELESVWGYPVIIIICLLIVMISLWYFKRKKWL